VCRGGVSCECFGGFLKIECCLSIYILVLKLSEYLLQGNKLLYHKMDETQHVSVFDRCSGPVVSLKTYRECNTQTLTCQFGLKRANCSEAGKKCHPSSTPSNTKMKRKSKLKLDIPEEEEVGIIKSSHNTYIPRPISQTIDFHRRPSQNCPSHSHVITLIEHAIDNNDALIFRSNMAALKKICFWSDEVEDKKLSFPEEAPKFVDATIRNKYKGKFIVKTPLWAIQHCLSLNNLSRKRYSLEVTDAAELSIACDGAYIICGYVNPCCNTTSSYEQRVDLPHDPSYSIVNANSRHYSLPMVALYIPSAGIYYSPRFVSDTSRLRAKGLWLGNHGLATKTVFQMLSSNSLRILKSSGHPDAEGQLWKFTDVYRIDIQGYNVPIPTNSVFLTGVHVSDSNICIPPDIMVGCERRSFKDTPTKAKLYVCLKERFVSNLVKSKSNRAGKKRYVAGSFIAFPEKFVENPLVIDSHFIENNQQVVMQI